MDDLEGGSSAPCPQWKISEDDLERCMDFLQKLTVLERGDRKLVLYKKVYKKEQFENIWFYIVTFKLDDQKNWIRNNQIALSESEINCCYINVDDVKPSKKPKV